MAMIPTGFKTLTITATRKSFLLYKCVGCGTHALAPVTSVGTGSATYHVFQSKNSKAKAEEKATAMAHAGIDKVEAKRRQMVNEEHNYQIMTDEIHCPSCMTLQPFSGYPKGLMIKKKVAQKNEEVAALHLEELPTLYTRETFDELANSAYGNLLLQALDQNRN